MIQIKEKEGWHYLAVKKISTLLHKNTLNHQGDFYCLNCPNSFRAKTLKLYHMIEHAKIMIIFVMS